MLEELDRESTKVELKKNYRKTKYQDQLKGRTNNYSGAKKYRTSQSIKLKKEKER